MTMKFITPRDLFSEIDVEDIFLNSGPRKSRVAIRFSIDRRMEHSMVLAKLGRFRTRYT